MKDLFSKFERVGRASFDNYYTLLLLILLATSFSLSFFCWNCYNVDPDTNILVHVFPFTKKLMIQAYRGNTFLVTPFLLLFGGTLFAVRLARSVFISLTLLVSYYLGKELFGKREGILSVTLALISSFFILLKYGEWVYTTFFAIISVYLYLKMIRKPTILRIALAGLTIGLGIYNKLENGYILIGLLFLSIALAKKKTVSKEKIIKVVKVFIPLIIFISLGAFPLIYYNFQNNFNTFNAVKESFSCQSPSKILDLNSRFKQIFTALSPGNEIFTSVFEAHYDLKEKTFIIPSLVPIIFFVPMIIILIFDNKIGRILLIFLFLLIFLNTFTPKSMKILHIHVLLPFIFLLMGRSVTVTWEKVRKLFYPIVAIFILFLIFNFSTYTFFFSRLSNPHWVNEKTPRLAKVHTKARLKMNEIYKLNNPFILPFKPYLIKRWTKGVCKKKWLDEKFAKPSCRNISKGLNCKESIKLIVPYPNYLYKGPNLWRKYICDYPTLNQSGCYRPYQHLMKESQRGRMKILNRKYIKDVDNDRAYVIFNFTC